MDSYDPIHSRKTIPVEFTNTGLVGLDIGGGFPAPYGRDPRGQQRPVPDPVSLIAEHIVEMATTPTQVPDLPANAPEWEREYRRRRRKREGEEAA